MPSDYLKIRLKCVPHKRALLTAMRKQMGRGQDGQFPFRYAQFEKLQKSGQEIENKLERSTQILHIWFTRVHVRTHTHIHRHTVLDDKYTSVHDLPIL